MTFFRPGGPAQSIFHFVRSHSSICFAAAALLLFVLCIGLLPAGTSEAGNQLVREQVQQYGFVPSGDQRRAHLVALIAVAVFSAISFLHGRRGGVTGQKLRLVPRFGAAACILLAALGLIGYLFLVPGLVVGCAAAAAISFLLFVIAAPHLRAPALERAVIALIGGYLAVLIVPGLLVHPIPLMEIAAIDLAQFENHLHSLLWRGAAIAAGQDFFRELPLHYGVLMPSIMSVAEARGQGLSIAEQLRFVQAGQVLFSLAAVCAYLAYRPRNYVGVLAALLLAGPYWAAAGLGIWHPNQTGFRSLGLPLGMLGLMLAGRLPPKRAAWWLGAVAGAALLLNLETAVAVSAAFVVFAVVRTRTTAFTLLLRMAAAAALAIVAYLVIYRLALGRLPFSAQSVELLSTAKRFAGGDFGARLFSAGHWGEGYYVVPFALLMFGHAMYVVIDGFRQLGRGALPLRAALRVSVALTLILWLAYYFNFPNWWQIWTHLFLYGFLVIDALDRRLFGIGTSSSAQPLATRFARMRVAPALFILLFFLAVLIPYTNGHLLKYMSAFMYPRWLGDVHEVSVLSGILLPKDKADLLQRKAEKLKELHAAARGGLVYLTFNVAFMPRLTGLYQPAPYRDMFAEIQGDLAFDQVMSNLLKRRPEVILIDAATGPLAVSGPRKDFQDRLRSAVSPAYRVAATEDGWQVWRPLDSR